jgi:hypothetical protein
LDPFRLPFRHQSGRSPLQEHHGAGRQADLLENVVAITGGLRQATSEFMLNRLA